jgi:hypothetical protein
MKRDDGRGAALEILNVIVPLTTGANGNEKKS